MKLSLTYIFCVLIFTFTSCLFRQGTPSVYTKIGKRQKSYGAEYNKISCDSAVKKHRNDYEVIARKLPHGLGENTYIQLNDADCPKTRYESLVMRHHSNLIQKDANKILKSYNIDTTSVYFSAATCNCYNMLSMPLSDIANDKYLNGKWLIEYNVGFSLYTQKLSVICANLAPFSGNIDSLDLSLDSYQDRLLDDKNYNMYYNIGKFLLADIAGQPNISTDSILIETCINPIVSASLTKGFYDFALTHELSHIILNHHAERKATLNQKRSKVDIVKYKFNQELEADSLAVMIMKKAFMNGVKSIPSNEYSTLEASYRYAPLIYLSWLNVLQQFEMHHIKSYRGIDSHPSAIDRRKSLINNYRKLKLYYEDDRNFADLMDGSSKFVLKIILEMFDLDSSDINFLERNGDVNCRIKLR